MSDRKYAAGAQAVVRAENADRRQLYRFRATRLGKKVEEVAAAEAKIRQAQAKRGEWIEVPANRRGTEWRWRKMR